MMRSLQTKHRRLAALAGVAVLIVAGWWVLRPSALASPEGVYSVQVVRRTFEQVLRRNGVLKPVNEQHIITKVSGTIKDLIEQGTVVEKDQVLLTLDPTPHENAKIAHEFAIKRSAAEYNRARQESLKTLNIAREDVKTLQLKLELEKMRLEDLKKGPAAIAHVNAQVNLENSKNVLAASEEELKVFESLAKLGYASQKDVRARQLQVNEQKIKVSDSELALQELFVNDPVSIAEQELVVSDAVKAHTAAIERVKALDAAIKRDQQRFQAQMEREKERLLRLEDNIAKTRYVAPASGVVVHKRTRWYAFTPGRSVWDGAEVVSLPNFDKMKVALTVDEGRIALITLNSPALIIPAGWYGKPFRGKITKIAEKGRDEFDSFQEETIAITGTANRQVFDVEVEVEDESPVLRLGARAVVAIQLRTLENVLVIPRTAIISDAEGQTFVRVTSRTGTERRAVKLIADNGLQTVVEGVQEGEWVQVVHDSQ